MSMRGRESRSSGAPNSSDLLVCFPSRAPLTLMPKTICSPARACEPSKRHSHSLSLISNYNKKSLLKRTRTRGGGHGSPVLWAKTKSSMGQEMEEPSSPKVTCAGQIRVRPKNGGSCKNWQSVMEEIERIHKKGRQKKKPSWMEALGLKKDVMHFLTCLRTLRFDFRCFGSLPAGADITSDDEDEDDEEDEDHTEDEEGSRTVFSKWFMVLQEEQDKGSIDRVKEKEKTKDDDDDDEEEEEEEGEEAACVPPPNALLLMRCRSAPAKSWLEERAQEEEESYEDEQKEKEKEEENSVLKRYDTEYYKISSDIAKETWVVGGMGDVLARSRSCKR